MMKRTKAVIFDLFETSFTDFILHVCKKCGKHIEKSILTGIVDKRIKTKSVCFEYVNPDVYRLLDHLKAKGLRLAIISNCSSEEVKVIKHSRIYQYFDQVILSYEVKMQKPDIRIYEEADLLWVAAAVFGKESVRLHLLENML